MNLDNFKTTIIDGKPLTLLPLVVGRRVHCILYGGDNGTIVAIHGTPTPQNVRMLGGGAMVMGGSAHVDVAFDGGHLNRMIPEAIVYGVQWRIIDEIRTAQQIAEALAHCEATAAANRITEAQAAKEAEAHKNATATKYAHLERVKAGEYASAKQGARNIRTELKAAFPGIKFSVRSDIFSGGDSIDISWGMGPTTKQVEAITNKYQEGHFNGMEDIYETDHGNPFPNLFGGAKYVHASRQDGDVWEAICNALCDLMGVAHPEDGKSYWRLGDDITRTARELLANTAFPVGASNVSVEHLPEGEENPEMSHTTFAPWYRVTFTAPNAPAKAEPAAVCESPMTGATVSENAEKNGIEIRFATKPAASILETLKAHGWRWSRFSCCWYTRASDAAREFAASLVSKVAAA